MVRSLIIYVMTGGIHSYSSDHGDLNGVARRFACDVSGWLAESVCGCWCWWRGSSPGMPRVCATVGARGAVTWAEVEAKVGAWIVHADHTVTWQLRQAIFEGEWFDAQRERHTCGSMPSPGP